MQLYSEEFLGGMEGIKVESLVKGKMNCLWRCSFVLKILTEINLVKMNRI